MKKAQMGKELRRLFQKLQVVLNSGRPQPAWLRTLACDLHELTHICEFETDSGPTELQISHIKKISKQLSEMSI